MSELHVTVRAQTQASPDQVRQTLTDFSPHRAQLFTNVSTDYLRATNEGPTSAEVTEGSRVLGGVWERNRYDWSEPDVIRAKTVDSNTWANGSSWTYHLAERPGGGTSVELDALRIPKNLRGQVVVLLLRVAGSRRFQRELQTTLDHIEQTSGARRQQ